MTLRAGDASASSSAAGDGSTLRLFVHTLRPRSELDRISTAGGRQLCRSACAAIVVALGVGGLGAELDAGVGGGGGEGEVTSGLTSLTAGSCCGFVDTSTDLPSLAFLDDERAANEDISDLLLMVVGGGRVKGPKFRTKLTELAPSLSPLTTDLVSKHARLIVIVVFLVVSSSAVPRPSRQV